MVEGYFSEKLHFRVTLAKNSCQFKKLIKINYIFVIANTYQIGKCYSVIELMKMH